MVNYSHPDLTQHPPRSGRVTLGGFAHLPRLIDKARAEIAGKAGEYHDNCPMDAQFFTFTGIGHEAFLAEVKKGGSDTHILDWVMKSTKVLPSQIAAWSQWISQHGPGGAGGHEWAAGVIKAAGPDRTDIRSFFDILDLDDYVSFGGKA